LNNGIDHSWRRHRRHHEHAKPFLGIFLQGRARHFGLLDRRVQAHQHGVAVTEKNPLMALATIAFCPPETPADALRYIAQEALRDLYPELMDRIPTGKMVHYLKCDAKRCMHLEVHPALTWDMVDKPCPSCGENLLTQADAEAYPYMEGARPREHCPFHPDYVGLHEWPAPSEPCPVCGVKGGPLDIDEINEKCVDKP